MSKTHYKVLHRIEAFYAGGAISLANSGDFIACAYYDDVKVVQVETGAVLHTFKGDTEPITALSFNPDTSILYGASRSLQIFCWDFATASVRRSWKGHSAPVAHLAVDGSGGLLASASADRSVRVWSTDGFYCTHVFRGHSGIVLRVLFQPRELNLISSSEDGEIRVWDLVAQNCIATLKGHFNAVTSLSIAPDGWTMLSAGRDNVAILWDLRANTKSATVPVFEAIEGAHILPEQQVDGSQKVGAKTSTLPNTQDYLFATAGEKGQIKIWSSLTGKCLCEQKLESHTEEGSQLTALEWSKAGILMSASEDARIALVWPEDFVKEKDLKIWKELIGSQGEVTDLRFIGPPAAPSHLAVATNSSIIRLYSLASKACEASIHGHTDIVLTMDLVQTAKGDIFLVSGSKDCTVKLWRLQVSNKIEASLVANIRGHTAAVTAVAFGRKSGGSMLVTASSDKMLKFWSLKGILGGQTILQGDLESAATVNAHEKDINCLAISPNEALVCTTSQDRTAKIWKLPSLVLHLRLGGHKRGVWAAAFSPLEQIIATASGDKMIKLWSIKDGSCLRTLQGHTASVLKLCYLDNGLQILSSGGDGLLKLWEVRTGECTATFEEQEGRVWALTSSGLQDRLIASGGADSLINIWEDSTQEMLEEHDNARAMEVGLQQEFSNAMQDNKLSAAAALAFRRQQPKQLLIVLKKAQEVVQDTEVQESLVKNMSKDDLKYALQIVRDWNTQARSAHQAQCLLHTIMSQHSHEILRQIPGLEEILAAVVPYTQRHMAHLERLMCSSYVLDYSLSRLQYVSDDIAH